MRRERRRRRLSMTSLIDVIFLLLLFFMLSSTFSRFAEIRLVSAAAGGAASDAELLFLKVTADALGLNNRPVPLEALAEALGTGADTAPGGRAVVVSLARGLSAQRLVDVLAVLRGLPGIAVTVLEPS